MGYYRAGGAISMVPSHTTIPPASVTPSPRGSADNETQHRRMNPMNVRAARRAMRRLSSFERVARRVVSFTKPHAGRKFHFGKKRGKR